MKNFFKIFILSLIVFSLQTFAQNNNVQNKNIAGTWLGKLKVPGQELRVVFNIKKADKRYLTATMESPDQTTQKIPVDTVILNDGNIKLDVKIAHGYFEGKFDPDNLIIAGSWHQLGNSFPLELKKVDKVEEVKGRKESEFPIHKKQGNDVSIVVNGYKLNGTLLVPTSNKPIDVVLIIAGSGPTDRNGNSTMLPGKNNSLKMLADTLYKNGIASLRYDKRGIGENKKVNESNVNFNLYVNDAVEWIKFLRRDNRFSKIIIAGHSEGSLVGMIAAERIKVDRFISLCGAGRPAYSLIEEQLKNNKLSNELLNSSYAIIDSLKLGNTVKNIDPSLTMLFRPSVQPYLISWFKYDPVKEISKLTIPILVIEGTTDIQVNVKDAKLLSSANKNARLDIVKNMNHILKDVNTTDRTKNIQSYSKPDLPLSKLLCKDIVDFIKQ